MLNMVMMLGRLTDDPEIKVSSGGKEYTKFSIAVQRSKTEKNPEPETDFFSCTAWDSTARIIFNWYHKGDIILIQGCLRNNHYTDKSSVKHYCEEIKVNQVHFTNSRSAAGSSGKQSEQGASDLSFSEEAMSEFEEMFSDTSNPF